MAIFQSVGQALHVSFFMETLPARQKSVAQIIFESVPRKVGIYDDYTPSTIDFSGLNDLEVRGQCAMVRSAVDTHLDKKGVYAIHAMYAHGVKKMVGVRKMSEHCFGALSTKNNMAALAMAWNVYGSKDQRTGLSERHIAAEFGLSKSAVRRDIVRMREALGVVEVEAVGILEAVFVGSGVCLPI